MDNVPREDLIRSTGLTVARLDITAAVVARADGEPDDDGRTMTGYPIVFDTWTEIDSMWEGHFLERVHPGALNRTLEQRGDRIQVLFNHGFDPVIGDKPLGKPDIQEARDYGLYTEVPLSRTSYNDDIIELLRDGALWGQSFRFTVLDERWVDEPDPSDDNPKGLPERTITEARVYEYGPVTFPAYEATTLGIRSVDAYRSWQQSNPTPQIGWSLTAANSNFDTGEPFVSDTGSPNPDSPPMLVPVGRKLAELSSPRRASTVDRLAKYLQTRDN